MSSQWSLSEGGSESEIKNISMEAEVTEESCYTTGFEGVERGRKPRNANKLQKLEKGKKWIFPQISRRNTSANNLILAQLS